MAAALKGQVYNPNLGFATIGNVGGRPKYPYDPFYGGLSPRVAVAWNPNFTDGIMGKIFGGKKTVIRGGYSRLFGRLNGVAQVLNPLLGAAFAQPVSCFGASISGQCLGTSGVTPSTAFRIGTDGLVAPLPAVSPTLAQPYYPGQNGNAAAADATVLDKTFRPNRSDIFDFTIQRQINDKSNRGSGLHRPHHPERISAHQSGCCSDNDDAGRTDLRQCLREYLPGRIKSGGVRSAPAFL